MAKVFGVLLIVLGVWIGIEWMNHGSVGAFGGLFAKAGLVEEGAKQPERRAERAAQAVDRAYRAGEGRVDRQLGRGSE